MLELNHVYKTYPGPVHALRNIDLFIDKGEFVFLTGPSGAGKSSLFNLVCGFDRASSGKIKVCGKHLTEMEKSEIPYFRRQLGIVFQDFKLIDSMTVFDNVSVPLKIRGDRDSQIESRVREALQSLGLSQRSEQMPETLSGGEKQRVAIARAIVHQPKLLIADEPTGNLDPELAIEIMRLLEKISLQGTTVVVATHDLSLVQRFKKRRIHLKLGELSEPEEVLI